MKKIYLTLGLSVLLAGANAQQKKQSKQKTTAIENSIKTARANHGASTQAVIWSNDFSSAATWTMTAGAGTTALWSIGTTPGAGTYSIGLIASTTAANGFALFDSDNDCSGNQIAHLTTTSSINLVGHPTVRLKFQQLYREDADSTRIGISTNGTTWAYLPINTTYTADAMSANPETVKVDISSVAGNQATVWVRFTYYSPTAASTWGASYGTNNGCGYNWLVDDAVIEDIPAIDAAITKATIAAPDCDLTSTEKVILNIKNNGIAAMTGFSLSYKVNLLTPVTETYTGSVAAGATATYTFTGMANFSAPGVVQTVATAITLTGDADPSNDKDTARTENLIPTVDTLNENFDGTSAMLGWSYAGANQGAWYFSGINHSAPAALGFNNGAAIVTGIDDWVFTNCVNLTAVTSYYLSYWGVVPTSTLTTYDALITTKIGNNNTIASMTTSIGSDVLDSLAYKYYRHVFTVPTTGTYNVGFHVQPNNQDTWFRIDDVILGKNQTTGINSIANSKDLSVYPNPTTGVLNIVTSATKATVEFYNAMGQHVMSKTLTNGANSIDMSGLSNGVYSVRIMQNNTFTVGKIIKTN